MGARFTAWAGRRVAALTITVMGVAVLAAAGISPARAAAPRSLAGSGDWLGEVNAYRTAAGVPPVTAVPEWVAGLQNHLNYLRYTPAGYKTGAYTSAHTENPSSPYYTDSGAAEASYSDLVQGAAGPPSEAIDGWLRAPFHAVGILRPQLSRIAFAQDQGGSAGLDIIQGLDYNLPEATGPVLFPGPNMHTDLVAYTGEYPNPLESCGWQNQTQAGLPLIALLPQDPSPGISATLSGPGGVTSTANGDLCLIDKNHFSTTDAVYGPAAASILASDHAVVLIRRTPLTTGTYTAHIDQSGAAPIEWSFGATAPAPVNVNSFQFSDGLAVPAKRHCRLCVTKAHPVAFVVSRHPRAHRAFKAQFADLYPFRIRISVRNRRGRTVLRRSWKLRAGRWSVPLRLRRRDDARGMRVVLRASFTHRPTGARRQRTVRITPRAMRFR